MAMTQSYLSPSPQQLEQLSTLDPQASVTMLNLLKFKADGGRQTYQRYGEAAAPFLQRSGAQIRYLGDVAATVIGTDEWDEVILVEYPTLQAFFDMTGDPDYPSQIRADALEDSRLYCTQPAA